MRDIDGISAWAALLLFFLFHAPLGLPQQEMIVDPKNKLSCATKLAAPPSPSRRKPRRMAEQAAPKHPPQEHAQLDPWSETIPLGGVGLPLAEAKRNGIPKTAYAAALRALARPAQLDLGVPFSALSDDIDPILMGGDTYERITEAFGEKVACEAMMVGQSYAFWQVLPILNVPSTIDYWVHREDLLRVLSMMRCDPSWYTRTHNRVLVPPYAPKAYDLPRVSGCVTRDHVRAFAAGFPNLSKRLETLIPWRKRRAEMLEADAEQANSVAASFLGIEVDLRTGSLVSADDTEFAVHLAVGSHESKRQEFEWERVYTFLDALAPRISQSPAVELYPELASASWSCALDAALHVPEIWTGQAALCVEGVEATAFGQRDACIAWHNDLLRSIRS
ncbi:hypothetical protein [Teichococcus oryzae]|uniref:Uncharacterized protein n=1 Tax=Teichococcus oryzae TaxID=1608942 RepID=A0A5B2TGH5_9PROT|nr:hypothetical protein [Pseudoroseomonas oryzae]KAA2213204.1 hypothetical protein F0Q34_11260 [Pseudoroseomonas oryzae]